MSNDSMFPNTGSPSEPIFSSTVSGLITQGFDAVTAAYPDEVTEVYSFREGSKTGTILFTITVIYTDTSHDAILSVERT